jgi:DNA-binding NarL/FixJ family response regulator
MHVLMVDDHLMFLQGLKNLLSVLAPELRVDTSADLSNTLQLMALSSYDLVLLDWHLAECDGELALSRLRDAGCTARIVVLSGETSAALIRRAVELGAAGYIPKSYNAEMMVAALRKVLSGQIFLPAETLSAEPSSRQRNQSDTARRLATLTARQADVYRAAARGLPNKLIARQLGIAESTVKTHLTSVFAALGVRSRAEAAYQASRDDIDIG